MPFCLLILKSVFFIPSIDFNLKFLNSINPLWAVVPFPICIPVLDCPYNSTLKNDFSGFPSIVASNNLPLDNLLNWNPLDLLPSITIGLFNLNMEIGCWLFGIVDEILTPALPVPLNVIFLLFSNIKWLKVFVKLLITLELVPSSNISPLFIKRETAVLFWKLKKPAMEPYNLVDFISPSFVNFMALLLAPKFWRETAVVFIESETIVDPSFKVAVVIPFGLPFNAIMLNVFLYFLLGLRGSTSSPWIVPEEIISIFSILKLWPPPSLTPMGP